MRQCAQEGYYFTSPKQHRTDHLTAAVTRLPKEQREEWTAHYLALMNHYGMEPTWNNAGIAHENGDVEQAHHRFKVALDQALCVRGNRDFADRAAYERFVAKLVKQRNQTRKARFQEEQSILAPLPLAPLQLVSPKSWRVPTCYGLERRRYSLT